MVPRSKRQRHVLNAPAACQEAPPCGGAAAGARGVIASLKRLHHDLKAQAYVLGHTVDYSALAASPAFAQLEQAARGLVHLRPEDVPGDEERIAFFINLYNVMMIHGVIALGITRSVMEVPTFFTTVAYQVGDDLLTPDDIEHGILRCNAPHPGRGGLSFGLDDPRRAWSPGRLEPRLHMALVCVAQSCPSIAFYEPEKLESQLELASFGFVGGSTTVDREKKSIKTSSIFKTYVQDFGGPKSLESFLLAHADPILSAELSVALEQGYTWRYSEHDWSLNGL